MKLAHSVVFKCSATYFCSEYEEDTCVIHISQYDEIFIYEDRLFKKFLSWNYEEVGYHAFLKVRILDYLM